MLFGPHIDNILYEFYNTNDHTALINKIIIGYVTTYAIESIYIPKIMAQLFMNINDKIILKHNIFKLIGAWTMTQVSYAYADSLNANVDPLLTKFLTDKIIDSIFIKYEATHKDINMSIIFNKIVTIRSNIEWIINRTCIVLIPRVISILIVILRLMMINFKLGLCSLIIILLEYIYVYRDFNTCIDKSYNEVELNDDIMEYIEDKFNNLHIISSMVNGIENEMSNCKDKSTYIMGIKIDSYGCVLNKQLDGYKLNTLVFIIILLYSYKLYDDNQISSEEITSILLIMNTLFNHMYEITAYTPEIIARLGVLNSNKKFIDELFSHKIKEGIDYEIKSNIIEFSNVTFAYNKDSNKIFNNYNKIIESNRLIAIYGQSGSGKSTFVKLICNILQPLSGTIYLDNIDISKLSSNTLKKNILFISQNTSSLFNNTIYYNLVYGLEDNDDIKIIDKVKFIIKKYNIFKLFKNIQSDLIDDYSFLDYNVGKNGELLSGGQRQIIHVIRAFINKTYKLIILDEPTSALDNESKNNIIKLIKDMHIDKTILIITHDNDIKNMCDEFIHINNN